ncbi:MAG TPA: DUF1176 domain-containing protein [Xanthobacteraceae bacterium]|jgi:hypothetical protein
MFRFALLLMALVVLPVIALAAELPLPRTVIEAGLRDPDCTLSFDEATVDLESPQELGSGLVLVEIPCWRAAYNFGSIFFAADPKAPDRARLLRFREWNGKKFEERTNLSGPSFDPKRKRLSSFHKGRGVGDCGSAGAWVWSGTEFRLQGYWLKVKCDGKNFDPEQEPRKWLVYPARR